MNSLDIDSFNSQTSESTTPAWVAKSFNDKDLVSWTKDAWESRVRDLDELRMSQRDNVARYMGQYTTYSNVGRLTDGQGLPRMNNARQSRININMTRRLVEMSVSKVNKISVESEAVPANYDDTNDREAAKIANKVLQHYRYLYQFQAFKSRIIRGARLVGEGYAYIGWNKNLGATKGEGTNFSILDDSKRIKLVRQERIGEIELKTLHRENVVFLLTPGMDAPMAYACIIREFRHYLDLQAEYPHLKDKLTPETCESWDDQSLSMKRLDKFIPVYKVYVRSTRWAPRGAYWSCSPETMLDEVTDNPMPFTPNMEVSELGNLPVERMTDIDVDGNFHAVSSLADINLLQSQLDKLTSLIFRNVWLFAHPKWVVPRSGVNLEQLSSGGLVLQSSGPFQPTLMNYPVITQDIFALWREIPKIMGEQMAVFQHSMGEAPKGARSASQLMIYDEQEEEARAPFRQKLESFVLSLEGKTLALASENFQPSDKRTINVLGENRLWKTESLDLKNLRKEQILRLKIPEGMPEGKYARIQFLSQLRQGAPTQFSEEQFLNSVGYGQQERFIDYAQRAILSAQAENELFLAAKTVEEPAFYEDHIGHWREHANVLQSRAFKALDPKDKKPLLEHIKAHEMLMVAKAAENNPIYQQQLSSLANFPLVFQLPEPPPIAPPMAGPGQMPGQAQGQLPPPMEMAPPEAPAQ